MFGAIGRWFKAVWYKMTGQIDEARRGLDSDPHVMRAKFDEIIKGKVSQISLADLPQILTKDGASVPLLSEVISLIENEMKTLNTVIGLNIELKGDNTGLLTANYMKAIDAIPTIVSSFKLKELKAFRAADKHTPIAPLFHRWEDSCTEIGEELNAVAINCSVKIVNENRVKFIKERGFKVFAYTVNSPNKAEELFNMGVDGIFTDHPDKMKHWLNYSNTDSFR